MDEANRNLTVNKLSEKQIARAVKNSGLRRAIIRDRWLYIMLAIPLLHIFVFQYIPLYGILIAFQDYNSYLGFFRSKWVGLKHFEGIVTDEYFRKVFFNTVRIGTVSFVFSFPAPILLALLLNEVKHMVYKKSVQTLTYLPHFISAVAICGMVVLMLEPETGLINIIAKAITGKSTYFMIESQWFIPVYVITGIWQSTGFSAIIYMAALSGIDPTLYESAVIDGANRFQRAIYITLPSIKPTVTMLLILGMPAIISVNFEKVLLLYRPIIYDVADVVPTYMYRRALLGADFSYGTAIGFFFSLLSLGLIAAANTVSKKLTETSLW